MALDPVPTWIHGAKHSGDILRQGTFNETGGAEGVSSPTAFRVRATQTPSNKVRVDPGGLLMLSPWDEGQTYSMRNASETLVEVPASSSLSANTWYINAWINDPNKPGGTVPVSKEFGPYNFLTCDPEPKDNNPAYACAQIDVPKNEATIPQDYIMDLREIAQPKIEPALRTYALLAEDRESLDTIGTDSTTGETWPRQAETVQEPIKIPKWATRARIVQTWAGVTSSSGVASGRVWVQIGGDGNPNRVKTQTVKYKIENANGRDPIIAADMVWIPPELRGTRQKFIPRGNKDASAATSVVVDGASTIITQIEFLQRIES